MITFIKKNLLVLLIGAIVGSALSGFTVYSAMLLQHNQSKKKLTSTFENRLKAKDVLLSECIAKDSYTNNNDFSPVIDKNKKGSIIIDLKPKIKQELEVSPSTNYKEGDTINDLTLLKTIHLTRRQKKRINKARYN